jgi:hypothetical protein
VQVATELTDRVDPDLVAQRLEDVEVGMRAPLDATAITEHDARELVRGAALPDPGRPVEEVGVRDPLGERGAQQALGLVLLR